MRLKIHKKRDGLVRSPGDDTRRGIPWGKIIYLLVLVAVALACLRWIGERASFVRGDALVFASTVEIAPRAVARVREVNVRENDRVAPGDPLVSLDLVEVRQRIAERQIEAEDRLAGLRRQIESAEGLADIARQAEQAQAGLVEALTRDAANVRDLVEAGAALRADLLDVERLLADAAREQEVLAARRRVAEAEVESARRHAQATSRAYEAEIAEIRKLLEDEVLVAPCAGVVTSVQMQAGEVARAAEPVLSIADESRAFVLAYFSGDNEPALSIGGRARLTFDDGLRAEGRIRKIYPYTRSLPPQYEKRYGPEVGHLVAEIEPDDPGVLQGRVLGTRVNVLMLRSWLAGIVEE